MSDDRSLQSSGNTAGPRDGFWRQPTDEHFAPPFPGAGYETPSEETVRHFCDFLRHCGLEPKAFDLRFRYHNSLLPAVREHQAVVGTVSLEIAEAECALEEVMRRRESASEEFVSAMAVAGLPLDPGAHGLNASDSVHTDSIGPSRVELALDQDCARPEEIAGRYGIAPPDDHSPRWYKQLLRAAPSWILPVAVGVIFGINLAVLTGFVDLDRPARGQGLVYALLGVVAGIAIEAAAGYGAAGIARLLALCTEPDPFDEGSFPRHRGGRLLVVVMTSVVLLIAVGIVTVDALGLQELHRQALRGELVADLEAQLQPWWVYIIAGAVISVPYLLYKFMNSWLGSANRLRHARVALLAQRYLSERRQNDAVVQAFVASQRVQNLREREKWLRERIEHSKRRHDAAREAACREAQAFRSVWDALVQTLCESRGKGSDPVAPTAAAETDVLGNASASQRGNGAVARVRDTLRRVVERRRRHGGDGYLS